MSSFTAQFYSTTSTAYTHRTYGAASRNQKEARTAKRSRSVYCREGATTVTTKPVRFGFETLLSVLRLYVFLNFSVLRWKTGVDTSSPKGTPGYMLTEFRRTVAHMQVFDVFIHYRVCRQTGALGLAFFFFPIVICSRLSLPPGVFPTTSRNVFSLSAKWVW